MNQYQVSLCYTDNINLIFFFEGMEYVIEKEEYILFEHNKLNQIAYFNDFDGYTHSIN